MYKQLLSMVACLIIAWSASSQSFFDDEWLPKYFQNSVDVILNNNVPDPLLPVYEIQIDPDSIINNVLPTHFGNNANGWMHFDWKIPGNRSMKNWKNANIQFMRMPGGNWSNQYFWTMEVPFPVKEEYVDPKTASWIMTSDDFMALADSLDAEPVICINYSLARYADVENPVEMAAGYAADWVRRVNIELGKDVRYWEIGNENFGPWIAGWVVDGDTTDGDEYGRYFNVFVDSMKAVDPTIKIGAQVVPEDNGIVTYGGYNWWNKQVLPLVIDKADFLICHDYFVWAEDQRTIPVEDILAAVDMIGTDKQLIEDNVEKYTDKPRDFLPVTMTEFNFRGGLKVISHLSGVFMSQAIGEFIRHGYDLPLIWDMINGYEEERGDHGILSKSEPGVEDYTPHASFFVYYYYQKYFGDRMVHSQTDNPDIKVYASEFSSGEQGMVIVNLSNEGSKIRIQSEDTSVYESMVWHTVSSSDLENRWFAINDIQPDNMLNGPENYEDILPYYKSIEGDVPELVLKPYSINYLVLTNAGIDIKGQSNPVSIRTSPDLSDQLHDTLKVSYDPAGGSLNLKCTLKHSGYYRIDLYNVTGSLVSRIDEGISLTDQFTVIRQAGSLPAGIYFIRIADDAGVREVEKVIIY